MRKLAIVIGVVVLGSAGAFAAELPTAEEVLKKVTAAYASMKSFEADMRMVADTRQGPMTSTGHIVAVRSEVDGKPVEKLCLTAKTTRKGADGKGELVDESRSVSDGAIAWTEDRHSDRPEVRVRKTDAQREGRLTFMETMARDMTRTWKGFNLKVIGEDVLDGQKMFVLEGSPAPDNPDKGLRSMTQKVWVSQADSTVRRDASTMQQVGSDKPMVTTIEWLNVKVNQPVDPALFVYTPPEGAKIDDRTKPKP